MTGRREISFMLQNIQSLKSHYQDLIADPYFMRSDIIFLTDTDTVPSDYFEIPGYLQLVRIDGNGKGSGIIVYVKESIYECFDRLKAYTSDTVQIISLFFGKKNRFLLVYVPPMYDLDLSFGTIRREVDVDEGYGTVLVGNFNVDFSSPIGKKFYKEMQDWTLLRLQTNPMHWKRGDKRTSAVFSFDDIVTGVYESERFDNNFPFYGRVVMFEDSFDDSSSSDTD